MIKVVANETLKEGTKDKVLNLLDEMIEKTRQEDGCIAYELYEDINKPNTLAFIEEWESMDKLKAHFESEHFKRIIPQVAEYKAQDDPVGVYKKIK